ncbi:hypothetical protein Leryth_002578 [Lithospermum erythrorhizon]|nr:hypothetical protein Leryth_002578 [Lithospermum erythrorhizon]
MVLVTDDLKANCKKTQKPRNKPLRFSSHTPVPYSSHPFVDFSIPVSCDPKNLCHAILSYADASSVEGNLAAETFRVENSGLPRMIFGCMDTSSSSNPEDAKTTGLIGMNRGSLSFVSQMGSGKFSYCIPGRDSSGVLLLGDVNLPWLKPLSYTPLVHVTTHLPYFDRVAYTIQLEGIKVGRTVLPLPKSVYVPDHTGAGQTMVDSGTQFTFLLGPVYNSLKNEFSRQMKGILRQLEDPNFVFQGVMDLCYRVELTRTILPSLTSVTMMFQGGVEMSVGGEKLLYKVPGVTREKDAIYCFTFGSSDLLGIEAFIIGHHHQQNMWMEFDLAKSRLGLAEVRCDLASQRLGVSHK